MIPFHYIVYYEPCCFSRNGVVTNIISSLLCENNSILHYSAKQQFTMTHRFCLIHMAPSLCIWWSKIKVENLLINMSTKFKLRTYVVISRDLMFSSPVIREIDTPLPLAGLCVSLVLPAAIVSCADANELWHVLLTILTWIFLLDRCCV